MRILGIDPGLQRTGYGIIELPDDPRAALPEPRLIEAGVVQLDRRTELEHRLVQLHQDLSQIIEEFAPSIVAVEKLYSHYAHPRTAILMAHARGVVLLAAQQQALQLVHVPATEIKKAVTGDGHASKEKMQRAIQAQYRLAQLPEPSDVADAIAVATCHAQRIAVQHL